MGIDPTQAVRLGRSTAVATRVGLGTAPLGNLFTPVDEVSARSTIRAGIEAGLRLIDTAPLYGHGLAERRVGAVLSELSQARRGDLVVSTKVGRLLRHARSSDFSRFAVGASAYVVEDDLTPVFDFSAAGVRASLEESMDRLGLDSVALALLHDPDDHMEQAIGVAYPALAEMRSDGRVRAVGAGMNHVAPLLRIVESTDVDVVLLAGRYSLLDTSGADNLLPLCKERGVGVVIGGVFNSGVLASPRHASRFDYGPVPEDVLRRAQEMASVCESFGVPLKAAALQFPFGHPAVSVVLLGARSPAELAENLFLISSEIPTELWDALMGRGLLEPGLPVPRTARGAP